MKIKRLVEVIKMRFVNKERLEKLSGESIPGQIFPVGKYAFVTEQTASRLREAEAEESQKQYQQKLLMYQNRTGHYM